MTTMTNISKTPRADSARKCATRVFNAAPDMGCYEWWQKALGFKLYVR